ncbi:MAG: L-glutamate gamma-semialdehyde dehydrogenase, partial [Undibacterium sp.]|nr:L-glutamate gamma-semialdehyde dehydrogenase [Undibacterium sp.]
IDSLIADPLSIASELAGQPHPGIALPADLFGGERKNSAGLDFSNELTLQKIARHFSACSQQVLTATPLLLGQVSSTNSHAITNPADHQDIVGHVIEADAHDVQTALAEAENYVMDWQTVAPIERAAILKKAADLLEAQTLDFMALAIREAGKSLPNALAEVREAVDFLRYYATQVESLPNTLALGPVVCISPWNFPLAIFIGEVSAALAAGNVVLAKPAEQTPLIAYRAIQLMHEAGVPRGALQFLPGTGEVVGAQLVADRRVKGVIFTGSTEVAQIINRTLVKRSLAENIDIPLIAETGGQNAMIVDSSALPEQVVNDVLSSAFDSAGQRCSALRVLCLQKEIADKTLEMLKGAMLELRVGKPDQLAIDIGPVIDVDAQKSLQAHIDSIREKAKNFYAMDLPLSCQKGTFIAPTVIEINSLAELS